MSWQTITKENGLSATEVFISKLSKGLRIEAEFYVSDSSDNGKISGEDVIDYVQYGTSKGLNEENLGYPILRLNEYELSYAGVPEKYCDLLSEAEFEALKLKKNDVLICRTNGNPKYVGKAALVMEDAEYAFASYLFRIRPNSKILPSVLVSYLNSKTGRKEIEKYAIVSNQANFSPAKFRQISIPEIPNTLQKSIDALFTKSWHLYKTSKANFALAENKLLNETGFKTYRPNQENSSIRKLKDCLKDSRFDAEYWQTDFDNIQNIIRKNKNGFDTLDQMFDVIAEKSQIDPEKEYLYAELADVSGATGTIDNLTPLKGNDLPSRGRMALKKDDIIVSSVEGSLDKIAVVSVEKDNIIGSTGFFVLRKKHYVPEVALVLLKSEPIKALLKRQAQGTILSAITKSSLHRVLLPKLDDKTQMEISELVIKSHIEIRDCKALLEKTKRAVEIFIEQDEKVAIAYLNK